MRRISHDPHKLTTALELAEKAVLEEPSWPAGEVTAAEIQAQYTLLDERMANVRRQMRDLEQARWELAQCVEDSRGMLRRIDHLTTILFGEFSHEKRRFGVREFDRTRNSQPTPDAPEEVQLMDGPEGGSLVARWKPIRLATYQAEAWTLDPADPEARLIEAQVSTRAKATFENLAPGSKVFVRVRAVASRKVGPWCEAVSRYVNG